MGERVLGLAGLGDGPWVCTAGLTNPHVKVVGLRFGTVKIYGSVIGKLHDQELVCELEGNGLHPVGKFFPFMRAVHLAGSTSMLLTFCSGRRELALQPD